VSKMTPSTTLEAKVIARNKLIELVKRMKLLL
jgi:hypothetical protein